MSTHMRTPPSETSKGASSHTNWLLVLVVALVAAAVGLGAGYLVFAPEPAGTLDAEAEALLDEFWAASEAGDPEVLELFPPDGHYFGLVVGETSETLLNNRIDAQAGVEPVGEPMVVGEYGSYDIAQRATTLDDVEYLIYLSFVDYYGTDGLAIRYVDTGVGIRAQ